mmetsp:Transcript_89202/g.238993  ORF Transcript_89202/g.238993 Transcript_89202/m.238993 type:complete len:311 (-) Transcript_89202:975-1907(-)
MSRAVLRAPNGPTGGAEMPGVTDALGVHAQAIAIAIMRAPLHVAQLTGVVQVAIALAFMRGAMPVPRAAVQILRAGRLRLRLLPVQHQAVLWWHTVAGRSHRILVVGISHSALGNHGGIGLPRHLVLRRQGLGRKLVTRQCLGISSGFLQRQINALLGCLVSLCLGNILQMRSVLLRFSDALRCLIEQLLGCIDWCLGCLLRELYRRRLSRRGWLMHILIVCILMVQVLRPAPRGFRGPHLRPVGHRLLQHRIHRRGSWRALLRRLPPRHVPEQLPNQLRHEALGGGLGLLAVSDQLAEQGAHHTSVLHH